MEWMQMKYKKPVDKQDVLCYGFISKSSEYHDGKFSVFKCRYYESNGAFVSRNIGNVITTHWMPLPEPPKTETNETTTN